mgnify:CR=1 FL=1
MNGHCPTGDPDATAMHRNIIGKTRGISDSAEFNPPDLIQRTLEARKKWLEEYQRHTTTDE